MVSNTEQSRPPTWANIWKASLVLETESASISREDNACRTRISDNRDILEVLSRKLCRSVFPLEKLQLL